MNTVHQWPFYSSLKYFKKPCTRTSKRY